MEAGLILSASVLRGFVLLCVCAAQSAWSPCQGCPLPRIDWTTSLEIGSLDPAGTLMTGTEIRSLVEFDGRVFAGSGIWMDTEDARPEQPGPQVFALDEPESEGGAWRVDLELTERVDELDGLHRYLTISAMHEVSFERDERGDDLPQPVSLLVASVWDRYDATEVFVRDTAGEWNKTTVIPHSEPPMPLPADACRRHIRSFELHRDAVTGADMIFAGTNSTAGCPARIYSGVYDPSASGSIQWGGDPEPWEEEPGANDRVTALEVANDRLYATVCGKLYERQDGPAPSWKLLFTHPIDFCPPGPGEYGFRGATAIPGASGQDLMVATEGLFPQIGRVELRPDVAHHQELDPQAYAYEAWGASVGYTIVAYNGMTPFEMPSGETVLLMGMEASTPFDPEAWKGWAPGAWYFVRHPDATYVLREIVDESIQPKPKLVSTRAMLPSPFPGERGRVIYAGGFDANHESCHDTAWLYRGELAEVTSLTVNECLAGKLKRAAASARARAACYAKAAKRGALPGACLEQASARFTGGADPAKAPFAELESEGDCLTSEDAPIVDADLAGFASDLGALVGAGTESRCDAAKLKCTGRYVRGALACYAKAARESGAVDPQCLAEELAKLSDSAKGCYERAIALGDCSNASAAPAARGVADGFVSRALCTLDPAAGGGGAAANALERDVARGREALPE